MRDDSVKLDSGVVTEPDVPVVPAEIDVVVGVIVAQCLAILGVVVLEPVEPPAGIVAVADREHLDAPVWNGAVQLERVILRHPATCYGL